MNKIIIITGQVNNVFFLNEIDYIKRYFNDVVVITYDEDSNSSHEIALKKNFKNYPINKNYFSEFLDLRFYKWLFEKNTIKEIKSISKFSLQSLRRLLYILIYGISYLKINKVIREEIEKNKNKEVVLYSYWLSRGAYAISTWNCHRNNDIAKIVARAHGYDLYSSRNKADYLPFRNYINENIDEIHFISEAGMEYFKHSTNTEKPKSLKYVSRLGTFNPLKYKKKILSKDTICIASCSSIIPVKRLDIIIDIVSRLEIPIRWIHIGDGYLYDDIKKYAKEKIVQQKFQFLGAINNSEILKTLIENDVDFFINMSDSEGIPVSIMEALSVGIPIIARNVGGVSEIVSSKNGLLIENVNESLTLIKYEIESRFENIDKYVIKSETCISIWNSLYNGESNYNAFFCKLSQY